MRRSKGYKSKTRHKLSKKVRKKGISPITKAIQEFKIGDKVHIIIDPSLQKGQPHPRFHGKTGKVVEKRGRAYLIEIKDGEARKVIISKPAHLLQQR